MTNQRALFVPNKTSPHHASNIYESIHDNTQVYVYAKKYLIRESNAAIENEDVPREQCVNRYIIRGRARVHTFNVCSM